MMAARQLSGTTLAALLDGMAEVPLAADCLVEGLAIDSREVRPGDCFLALSGSRDHGARHIREAASAGAVAVVMEPSTLRPAVSVPIIELPGLRARLGELAQRFYGPAIESMRLIAITGTNGKTTVAQLCAQALQSLFGESGYLGTLGYGRLDALVPGPNTTPDAVTLRRVLVGLAGEGCRYAALEASSHALDQGRLDALPLEVAVFTGFGHDHLDYHGTLAAYGQAKQRLFRHAGLRVAVLNADDGYADAMRRAVLPGTAIRNFSLQAGRTDAEVVATHVACSLEGTRLEVRTPEGQVTIDSPLLGDFNAQNLLAALSALLALGIPAQRAAAALSAATPVRGRMELIRPHGDAPLVCVDYAHSPDSLSRVLQTLRAAGPRRIFCVFGCGGDRDVSKRGPMGTIAEALADVVVLTSDNPRGEAPGAIVADIKAGMRMPGKAHVQIDRRSAIGWAIAQAGAGDVVLIAGKGHETTQVLGNIATPFDDLAVARAALEASHD